MWQKSLLALLLIALPAGAETLKRMQVMMGTFATIAVPAEDAGCIEKGFARLKRVEQSLSSYDPSADIYRLNRDGIAAISADTHEALCNAARYYAQSGGYFDITVGSLTRGLFRFGESERLPAAREMDAASVGFDLLEFNVTHARLKQGAKADLGGFGKGFGVDKAMAALKACGVTRAEVGLSGDIRCLGRCTLAVQDPFSDALLMRFETRQSETGISTSGNYRRFVKDPSHSHLIDPKMKRSEKSVASVTLVGTVSSSDLDAWTTAAAVMPPEKAAAFLRRLPVAHLIVYTDGSIVRSQNLADFITILNH